MTDDELLKHIDKVSTEYVGDFTHLSSAIGAVMVGRLYGWRVLRIITSSSIYTRHQRVLGLDFKTVLKEETPLSHRSLGYSIAKKLDKFWEIVTGLFTIDAHEKKLFR